MDKNSNKYKKKTIKAEDAYQSNIDSATIISDFVKIAPIKIETDIKTSKINSITTSVITDTLNISNIETNIDNKENTNVSKEVSIKKQEQKEVIKTTTDTKINVVKKANEYSNAKNSSYNCVIVIGVFRDANNTKAIINKLQAIGYPYVEGALREGISYVGVPVACNDKQKKQELLKELNKTFGIRSWIKKI